MQRRLLLLALLISAQWMTSQNHRFIYEYRFVSDTLVADIVRTELVNLDVLDDRAFFLRATQVR